MVPFDLFLKNQKSQKLLSALGSKKGCGVCLCGVRYPKSQYLGSPLRHSICNDRGRIKLFFDLPTPPVGKRL
jgi:hypothetical protein